MLKSPVVASALYGHGTSFRVDRRIEAFFIQIWVVFSLPCTYTLGVFCVTLRAMLHSIKPTVVFTDLIDL